jgi:ABC-type polysaccharide/polyol phosphate transport system ATPase subunit
VLFNPELTASENVYLKYDTWSYKKGSSDYIDEILKFAELTEFVNLPVRIIFLEWLYISFSLQ